MNVRPNIPPQTDEFAKAAALLLRALRDPDGSAFHLFKAHIASTLDDDQKGAIAWAALMACPTSVIEAVVENVARPADIHPEIIGSGAEAWKSAADQWASFASQGELRAFAGAAVRGMTPKNRKALLDWLNNGGADA